MNLLRSLTGRLTLAQDTVDSDSSAAPSYQMEVKSFNEETCRTLPQICSEAKIYKKMIDISKIICGGLSQIHLDKFFNLGLAQPCLQVLTPRHGRWLISLRGMRTAVLELYFNCVTFFS